jgi:MoxR-like ATPase
MQERRVTLDGKTHVLSDRFMVVATENPIEQQGTYPLPEAQLDRFLFKHTLAYPSEAEELMLVQSRGTTVRMPDPIALGFAPVIERDRLTDYVSLVGTIRLSEPVASYIVNLIRATRMSPDLSHGASPRSGAMLAVAARAHAVLDGRDYVIPDDVQALLLPSLRHRVILSPAAEVDGRKVDEIVRAIIEQVEAPR